MNATSLWELMVRTGSEHEATVAEFLGAIFGAPPVTYTDFATGRTIVSVYLERKPQGGRAEVRKKLRQAAGLKGRAGRLPCFVLREVRAQDWAESWKRHFKPFEIGSGLLIKPTWSRRHPRAGQAVITLDPGLSFGTGQHPTTAFCLEQLVRRREAPYVSRGGRFQPLTDHSLLDIGTGSGILAIAAAGLGYAPVYALDSDADAIRIARANARRNRVLARIQFSDQDLAKLPHDPAEPYSTVCANLTADLLIDERKRIVAQLARGGALILAGILKNEFGNVLQEYERLGFRLIASRAEKEWRSGTLQQV